MKRKNTKELLKEIRILFKQQKDMIENFLNKSKVVEKNEKDISFQSIH